MKSKAIRGAKQKLAQRQKELENSEAWHEKKRLEAERQHKRRQTDLYGLPDGVELLSREQRRQARALEAKKALENSPQKKSSPRGPRLSSGENQRSPRPEEKEQKNNEEEVDEDSKREATAVPPILRRDVIVASPRTPGRTAASTTPKDKEPHVETSDTLPTDNEPHVEASDTLPTDNEPHVEASDALPTDNEPHAKPAPSTDPHPASELALKKSASQASDVSAISSNSDDGKRLMTPSSSRESLIERRCTSYYYAHICN